MPELEEQQRDLTLTIGGTYTRVFALFLDERVTQWRGEWHEYFVYEAGEAVELEPGEAFVALLKTMNAKPGLPGSEQFWSPLTRMDLAPYTVEIVCEGVFTLKEGEGLTVDKAEGLIEPEVTPAMTKEAPSSAHYYVKLTEIATGAVSYPIAGTMLFKKP